MSYPEVINENQNPLTQEVTLKGEILESQIQYSLKLPDNYGLCSTCDNLRYRKTKLSDEEIWCSAYNSNPNYEPRLKPSRIDPIEKCSTYYPVGQLTLTQMTGIATIIDLNPKRIIGFGNDENSDKFEVKFRKPD